MKLTACVPHMRGDEPARREAVLRLLAVFPTCVGMNRINWMWTRVTSTCSPHAWG